MINRRHTGDGEFGNSSEGALPGPDIFARIAGLHSSPRENSECTNTGNRVPGNENPLTNHEAPNPAPKGKETPSRSCHPLKKSVRPSHSKGSVTPSGENEFSRTGTPTGAPILQDNPKGSSPGPGAGRTILRNPVPAIGTSQRGALLVGRANAGVEREEPDPQGTGHLDRNRRLPNGLGSVVPGDPHRGPMVQQREGASYKLPGTAGGVPSDQDFSEVSIERPRSPENGQSDSGRVRKQHGRDRLHPDNADCQGSLDVVPPKGNNLVGPAPSGQRQHDSRPGIERNEGPLRLAAKQGNLWKDPPSISQSERRPLCLPPDLPAAEIFQLEAGPSSRSHRCLPAELEGPVRLCQPTMESRGVGPRYGGNARSGSGPRCPNLAIPAMVPETTQLAVVHPTENSAPAGSNAGDSGGLPTRAQPPASRLAYLRQRYSSQNLSKEASDLLLSSWRQKSSQSYDSLCRKWIGWCTERGSDPVSGPIEEVVNFLAHLYGKGYQYRSLNAYRSAIASMHTQIDGASIGQHPLVSRLLKGAFHSRPPLPRYTETWEVSKVLALLSEQDVSHISPLKVLSQRTVMLLTLTRPSRSADLSKLDLKGYRNSPEGAVFHPSDLAKQSRQGKDLKEFFFPRFPGNQKLCPVYSLEQYVRATQPLQGDASQLFISFIKPHRPVSSSTIARWLKEVIQAAGIDTAIFKAHSVRAASTSAAASLGISTNEILEAADWSTNSTFQRFYYKPTHSSAFGKAVLSATNNTIDM